MTERYKKIAPQLQGIYVDLDVCRNTGMNPEYCIMPAEMELPMQWAALRAQVPLLKKMIAAGMDVNEQDCRGYTALHAGAVGYSKEAVDVLLKAGADVNLTSANKETALDLLCRGNYTWKEPYEVATVLLKAGSKPAENLNGFINNTPSSFLSEKEELKELADQATKMQQINSQKILSVQKASEGR